MMHQLTRILGNQDFATDSKNPPTDLPQRIRGRSESVGVFGSSIQSLLALLALLALTSPGHAQGDSDTESKFIAMVKNATLKGTWAPIAGGQLGSEKKDEAYRIVRAEKKEDGKWNIVSLFEVRGELVEFPISAVVKFAGDTAVLILDNVRAGPGRANWSARVMFHDDVYTGRWWETANREHGGTISGLVTRPSN